MADGRNIRAEHEATPRHLERMGRVSAEVARRLTEGKFLRQGLVL